MRRLIHRLRDDMQAQDLAEYGIALAVIAAGVGVLALAIGADVSAIWAQAQTNIATAI